MENYLETLEFERANQQRLLADYYSGDLCQDEMPDLINSLLEVEGVGKRHVQRAFCFGAAIGASVVLCLFLWLPLI